MVFGLFENNKPQQRASFTDLDEEDELPDVDSIGLDDDLDLDLDSDEDDLDVDFEEI